MLFHNFSIPVSGAIFPADLLLAVKIYDAFFQADPDPVDPV